MLKLETMANIKEAEFKTKMAVLVQTKRVNPEESQVRHQSLRKTKDQLTVGRHIVMSTGQHRKRHRQDREVLLLKRPEIVEHSPQRVKRRNMATSSAN